MTTHILKVRPDYFHAIWDGDKTFEIRFNDRDFKVGDVLDLRGFEPETQRFTGDHLLRSVLYVLHGGLFGLAEGYVCMSLGPWDGGT